jgi:hypothetical protein
MRLFDPTPTLQNRLASRHRFRHARSILSVTTSSRQVRHTYGLAISPLAVALHHDGLVSMVSNSRMFSADWQGKRLPCNKRYVQLSTSSMLLLDLSPFQSLVARPMLNAQNRDTPRLEAGGGQQVRPLGAAHHLQQRARRRNSLQDRRDVATVAAPSR